MAGKGPVFGDIHPLSWFRRIDFRPPGSAALARAGWDPRSVAARSINIVKNNLKTEQKPNFLSLVPSEFRDYVAGMANKAYGIKGRALGMTLDGFTEAMALQWLAKREAFKLVASEAQFDQTTFVGQDYKGTVLALSQSGSLIAIDPHMTIYDRLSLRENLNVPEEQAGGLRSAAKIGERLYAGEVNTSSIINLAKKDTKPEFQAENFKEASQALTNLGATFNSIQEMTQDPEGIFVPKVKKPQ